MTHESSWLRKLAYWGARYGTDEFVKISPAIIGGAFSGVLLKQRRVVQQNLRRIRGGHRRTFASEQRDVLQTFVEYAHCLTESLGFERMSPAQVKYRVNGEGILSALSHDASGFIVLTAHVGGWDLAARHLQQHLARPVTVVMTREQNGAARQFHDAIRKRGGVAIEHTGDDALVGLRLLRDLRSGGIVAVQLDRVPNNQRSVETQLFGAPFHVPQGPFQLAAIAGVPLVPVFCARRGYFDYEVSLCPPIAVAKRPNSAELAAAAGQATRELESFLQRYPTQWFNFQTPIGALNSRQTTHS